MERVKTFPKVIPVDGRTVEPPHVRRDRLPSGYADPGPRAVRAPLTGMTAVAFSGIPPHLAPPSLHTDDRHPVRAGPRRDGGGGGGAAGTRGGPSLTGCQAPRTTGSWSSVTHFSLSSGHSRLISRAYPAER